MKGLSFSAVLSKDQVEEIASITADKVNQTVKHQRNNEDWYEREFKRMRDRENKLNQLVANKELLIENWRDTAKQWKEKVDKYKEKYGELD